MKIATLIVIAFGLLTPSKKALHMFQQNRYELKRYGQWMVEFLNRNIAEVTKTIGYFLVSIVLIIFNMDKLLLGFILVVSSIMFLIEVKKTYIKPLILTARVKRQIFVMVLIYGLLIALCFNQEMLLLLIALLSPFIPWAAVVIMHAVTLPIETVVQHHFMGQAKKILDTHPNLKVVGITGSYGKTSSKNVLQEVLSLEYYSLMTPASFNTPMGITKTIRESLKSIHEVFICEMGADKVGDIEFLSKFVEPDFAIVTSIGPQHLNTFKSLDNIINEKMRLVENLSANGVAVLNVDNEYIRNYEIKNNCKVIWYGIDEETVDYRATNIVYGVHGSTFDVVAEDNVYSFETRLLGKHNISNILAAIAMGREMGISWRKLQIAVKQVKFIEHRLELKRMNNRRFIDNAFNSNPVGAQMSLEVLSMMPGKRVIITPGMIDLGEIQTAENKKFGAHMIDHADLVLLVGQHQTEPILEGLQESGFNQDNVLIFDTVQEALSYVYQNTTDEDTILLENDLPDAFNS